MSGIKISIVTISYNEVKNIRKTIESVMGQTYSNIEYIVVDGGSKDGTADIIKEYSDRLAYWCSKHDGGLFFGMNKGLARCTGDYVTFCNAGDSLATKEIVEHVVEVVQREHSPDLIYGDCESLVNGKVMVRTAHGPGFINYGMPASHQAMFYKLSVIREHSLNYDTSYRIAADYKFTYQFLRVGKGSAYLKEPVALFDEQGVSCKNRMRGLMECSRARKEAGSVSLPKRLYIISLQCGALFLSGYLGPIYRMVRLRKSVS